MSPAIILALIIAVVASGVVVTFLCGLAYQRGTADAYEEIARQVSTEVFGLIDELERARQPSHVESQREAGREGRQ